MSIAFGNSCKLFEAYEAIERCEMLPDGLYKAFRVVLTVELSWLLFTPQSMISGYV